MEQPVLKTRYCCNPFTKLNHSTKSTNLRSVMKWMCNKMPHKVLSVDMKICDRCRKELAAFKTLNSDDDIPVEPIEVPSTSTDHSVVFPDIALTALNASLQSMNESPVSKKKILHPRYTRNKLRRIGDAVRVNIFQSNVDEDDSLETSAEDEMVAQFKEKFKISNRSEKIRILTSLPKSWTVKKIEQEFQATNFMVRTAKKLVREKGIMSSPNPKPGKSLDDHTANLVRCFYASDEVSRAMPGMKDFVSVKDGYERKHVQKRLILNNIDELYRNFKSENPEVKIGFSKFAELRPKNCVLAGASGTHSVCVCTIHQNVKLMLIGGKIAELTKNDDVPLISYQHCLAAITCNPAQSECFLNECSNCPGPSKLIDHLRAIMEEEMVENITYKQWVSVDRTTLETVTKELDEYLDVLGQKLLTLRRHSFIAIQQSTFQANVKNLLQIGEVLVVCDFAENYSFVLQDEAQGFHWNNAQSTIHPFVVYFKEDDLINHVSFVIISESLRHDTSAVHLFQKKLLRFLSQKFIDTSFNKVYYFSDGAASQYKNRKNFVNLCLHEEDFGLKAEWHFSATSHGKGACDGVGGTVKRLAARASLQKPYEDQIMTPQQLFKWADANITSVVFEYCTTEEHDAHAKVLEERFNNACTITGTQKLHGFVPISKHKVATKVYSFSDQVKEELVSELEEELTALDGEEELNLININGYVTCAYDGKWYAACVLSVDSINEEITLSFLHPPAPFHSCAYPTPEDKLSVPFSDILTRINPTTVTGRSYSLNKHEVKLADHKLSLYKKL